MKPERWQQLDQLFHSALAHKAEERSLFLDEACGGDDSLHKQIEALLAAHQEAGSFIESPALEVEARSVANDQNELTVGRTIGHYRIVSLLGAGGMGEVYLAEDMTLGRKVALKLLPADFTRDTDRVRRFQQEAHAASALNHPNIVTVYEIAHIGDRHLIATEFIDGETLRERIRGSRSQTCEDGSEKAGTALPIREVLNIGIQIADALAAAHEAGIVHRDVKPENIMLRRRDSYIKVLDFGLAKLTPVGFGDDIDTEAATRLQVKTSAGLVMGTVTYMSPEQTRGEKVDARTDIWSLGVVLYELLAGCAPFERPTPSEVIAAILERDPPPLADYVGEIPSELGRIINKTLTKDKDKRYQSATDLLIDLRQRLLASEQEIYRSTTRESSIAVLPFANLSADPENEFFCDGLAEELLNALTKLEGLYVVARTSAFFFKGKEVDVREIGQKLNVSCVLEGSVRKAGDRLRVIAQLVNVVDGYHLWSERYDRKLENVFEIQDEICLAIVQALKLRLLGKEKAALLKRHTDDSEAYQFYLRGRHFWNKRTADGLIKAIREFQQAIDLDPNYALAYVGLADSYVLLEAYAGTPASEVRPKARAAVERALQLDDSLAEAHASLGLIQLFTWNFGEAEKEYKRAIELNPNCATAYFYYGFYLHEVKGKFDDAMAEIRRAQRLDPLSPRISNEITGIHASKGELDAAQEAAKKVIELDPNFSGAHRVLGVVYLRQRRYDEAIAEFKKAVELSGRGSWELSGLGVYCAMAGDKTGARTILKELEEKYDRREALGELIAYVYAALGDKERAFAWLEKDFEARSGLLPWIAYAPWSDTLRDVLSSDPRFPDLLRRMGIAQD